MTRLGYACYHAWGIYHSISLQSSPALVTGVTVSTYTHH